MVSLKYLQVGLLDLQNRYVGASKFPIVTAGLDGQPFMAVQ